MSMYVSILTNFNFQQVIRASQASPVVRDYLVYLVLLTKLKDFLECRVFLVAQDLQVFQDLKALLVSLVSRVLLVPA